MNLVFGLLLLAAAVAGVLMTAQLVVIHPTAGVALCLAPATWAFGGRSDIALGEAAGFHMYVSDLVAVVLIVAALMQLGPLGDWAWSLTGITVLLGLALAQGIIFFGTAAAVNEARTSIYLIAATWWAVTVDWAKRDFGKAALIAGWAFVGLAVLHLALYGFATVNVAGDGPSSDASHRMLNSTQALVLALCTATVIFDQDRRRRTVMLFSSAVFTLVVIAAQNRSVWVAIIGGFVAVLLLSVDSGRRRRAFGALALVALVAALVATDTLGGSVGSKLTTAGTNTLTWQWRLESWQQLLTSWLSTGPIGIAFGQPFGYGFERLVNGAVTTVSAHSWYVELPLRVGVLGTMLWLFLIVRGIVRARKTDVAALFFGAAFLCFSAAYVLPWNVAPWLGILITVPAFARRGLAAVPPLRERPDALATQVASRTTMSSPIMATDQRT